jgi:DNA polymerase I
MQHGARLQAWRGIKKGAGMQNIAFDTETTGLKPHGTDRRMFAYSTATESGAVQVVRLDGLDGLGEGEGLRRLRNFWQLAEMGAIVPVMHNSKFDLAFSEKALGRRLAEGVRFHDTLLLSHVLRSDHPGHGLKDLAWDYGGFPKDDERAVKRYLRGGAEDYSKVPPSIMQRYQVADADRTMFLLLFMLPRVEAVQKWKEAYEWECKLVPVTLRMEERGFMVDRGRCLRQADRLRAGAMQVLDEVERLYGQRVDLTDNTIRRIVFHEMKLPVLARTETGLPSVKKEILGELATGPAKGNRLLDLIVKYKSWRRGASVLEGYLEHANEEGIIHPSIHTCRARTGRESCSEPNLQNVERAGDLTNPYPIGARKVFRPRPGFVHFHIDYAGIELRLLVHYSRDDVLVEELNRPGGDPHLLAARIFYPQFTDAEMAAYGRSVPGYLAAGIDAHEKGSDEYSTLRGLAKGTNFAVPYGAGAKKASLSLMLPAELGSKRFARYKGEFPGLVNLSREVGGWVRKDGGVTTTMGRFLHVSKAEAYVGTNYLIQGTAAEVLKRSQVRVAALLSTATGGEVQILLPIHDEIIIEYPRKRLAEARGLFRQVREIMVDFPMFNVPLEIDLKVATTDWADKRKFRLEE